MPPRLAIIIVTYNSSHEIEGCLSSLATHPPSATHEVIVVDNASQDGTADLLRTRWPEVRLLRAEGNIGFARANNIGIDQTDAEFVLLLNPDTVVRAGAIDTLVAALEGRPEASAAGPRLVDATGRAELSFGRMVGPWAELRQKVLVRGHARALPLVSALVERMTRRPGRPDWVSGACLLVRRADAVAAGRFDERYFMYLEDVDFCAALRARGREILFEPDAEVTHLRGQSRRSAAAPTARAYRRSQVAFYDKHHPRWAGLLKLYLHLRGQL
jgi:GT2 family glycosyltransferase